MSVMDSRVAELTFDNSKFQKGVEDSRKTLKQFDQDLDKVGNNNGLNAISKAASNMTFGAAESAVIGLTTRFNALGIIGMTALQNITNRAVNMGLSMAKALVVEPTTTGLQEYELKMDNIRTSMVNTGSDLRTVNSVLNDLNTYSDKTIYKFSDMTNALARLTTNGVKDLNLAKNVIQGMANAAAYAGLDNTKLQSIMYNTSQAYSLGYMSLMDFRSLENAGIGNKFKEVAIQTAAEMGTLKKNADGTYKVAVKGEKAITVTAENMRNTLSGKWLTNDVMTEVFRKYSDETTELGKAASEAATQITTASKMWDTWKEAAQSGWAQNWELIIGDYEEAKQLWTSLNEVVAGQNGFLTKFNNGISDALKEWRTFSGRQLMIRSFKNLWSGFTKVVGTAKEAFKDMFPEKYGNWLVDVTRKFYRFSKSVSPTAESLEKLKSVFKGVFSVFKIGGNVFSSVGRILRLMIPGLKGTAGGFLDNAASLGDLLTGLADYLEKNDSIFKGLKKVYDMAKKVFDFLAKVGHGLVKTIEDTFGIDIHIPTFDEVLNALTNIKNFFKPVTDLFNSFKTTVSGGFMKVRDVLSGVFGKDGIFGSGGVDMKTIAGIGLGIGALIKVKDAVDPLKLLIDIFSKGFTKAIDLSGILDDLGDGLSALVANVRSDALLSIAGAITLLAVSCLILASIKTEALFQAGGALAAIGAGALYLIESFSKLTAGLESWKSLAKTLTKEIGMAFVLNTFGSALIKFAGAVVIMAAAFWIFSKVSPDDLFAAVVGMAVSVGAMVLALQKLQHIKAGTLVAAGTAMLLASVGVVALAAALKFFSTIAQGDEMLSAIEGMVASLGMLSLMLFALGRNVDPAPLLAAGAAMLIASIGVVALAAAFKIFSTVAQGDELLSAIEGMVTALGAVSLALYALSTLCNPADLLAAGAAMLMASVAVVALAGALLLLSLVPVDIFSTLAAALVPVTGALIALSFVPSGPLLAGAAALLIVSVAMLALSASVVVLAAGLAMLNGVNIGGIADGFFALAGPLAIVGAALIVVSAGIVTLTAALLLFSPALLVLAGAAIELEAFNLIIAGIAKSIDKTSNAFDKFVTNVEKLTSIEGTMSGIGSAIKASVDTMKESLKATRGSFKEDGMEIIKAVQEGIDTQPLDLASKLQSIISAGSEIFGPDILGANLNAAFRAAFGQIDFVGISSQFGIAMQETLMLTDIGPAITTMVNAMVTQLSVGLGGSEAVTRVRDAGNSIVNEAVKGAKSVDTSSIGVHIGEGLINGMKSMEKRVEEAAKRLAEKAKSAIQLASQVHSPSRFTTWVGEMDGLGLANGLTNMTKTVRAAAHALTSTVNESLNEVSEHTVPVFDMSDVYNSMMEFDDTWRPVIKPTLDMSGVNPGSLNASIVASQTAAGYNLNGTSGQSTGSTVASMQFTQNNYSPKALSRTEIYRQTKNQFAQIEGLVNNR